MKLIARIARASVPELIRIACVLSLAGLAIIVYSILSPRPLAVISAMSVGHGIGGAAFICYVLAIVLDTVSRERGAKRQRADESQPPSRDSA
jgi:hypothetical protein